MDDPVGDYNKALLMACYQLYFSLLVPGISIVYPYIKMSESRRNLAESDEFQWE